MQEYEFTNRQNELIEDLSKKMNFVGILMIIGAVLSLISGVVVLFMSASQGIVDFSSIIQGVLLLFVGLWTRNAARAFRRVVNTTGTDIENLMSALRELRKLYTLQYWLVLIALIFLAIGLVIALVVSLATA